MKNILAIILLYASYANAMDNEWWLADRALILPRMDEKREQKEISRLQQNILQEIEQRLANNESLDQSLKTNNYTPLQWLATQSDHIKLLERVLQQ